MTGVTPKIAAKRDQFDTPPIPSTELHPSSMDGVQRWACGHALAEHTREDARRCIQEQLTPPHKRKVPQHDEGGASAPPASQSAFEASIAPRTAADICAEATRLVGGARQSQHGNKRDNFQNIAELWNGYFRIKCHVNNERPVTPFDAHDVGCMMELLKIARRFSGEFNIDDYTDAAGYAGCAGEIAAAQPHASLNLNKPS